jgi:hypothetical protein
MMLRRVVAAMWMHWQPTVMLDHFLLDEVMFDPFFGVVFHV